MVWDSQGNLYAVGDFNLVNQSHQDGFAKWDGSSWITIAPNLLLGGVKCLAIDHLDNIYLGGQMHNAEGQPINYITKWDGSNFIELPGTDGWIYDLAFDNNGNLYAAGSFANAGGIRVNNIAMFDGCKWHAIKEGLNDSVYSITFDSANNLYVGGRFNRAGDIDTEKVAMWNGVEWSGIGELNLGNGFVQDVFYDNPTGTLYIGGFFNFYVNGTTSVKNIAAFSNNTWSNLGEGLNTQVNCILMGPQGQLYVGGHFQSSASLSLSRIARWDGISWHQMDSGTDDAVRVCALSPNNDIYIGGQFKAASGNTVNGIAKWEPSSQASALNFDGQDGYVVISDNNDLDFDTNEDFSIQVNVRVPTSPQNNLQAAGNVIIEKWNGQSIGYPYAIRYLNQGNQHHGKIRAGRGDGTNFPSIVSTSNVNDGQWHNITFVKNGSQLFLYLDGVLEATGTDYTTNTTTNGLAVNIGRRNNNTVHFTGDINELRIWKKALCEDEINTFINCEIDPNQVDSLNAYFKFNDEQISGPETTVLSNEMNNTLHGTLVNFEFTGTISNWIDEWKYYRWEFVHI